MSNVTTAFYRLSQWKAPLDTDQVAAYSQASNIISSPWLPF